MIGNSTTMNNSNKSRRQNQIIFKCEICDKEFKSNNGLRYHFNSTHKTFHLQSQLTAHVKIFHGNKMKCLKCDSCGKSFSQAQSLKNHINSVHNGQKDHKCDSCGKEFSQGGHLKRHIDAVHNG